MFRTFFDYCELTSKFLEHATKDIRERGSLTRFDALFRHACPPEFLLDMAREIYVKRYPPREDILNGRSTYKTLRGGVRLTGYHREEVDHQFCPTCRKATLVDFLVVHSSSAAPRCFLCMKRSDPRDIKYYKMADEVRTAEDYLQMIEFIEEFLRAHPPPPYEPVQLLAHPACSTTTLPKEREEMKDLD